MRKNLHSKILKGEPKEQHLSTVPKPCSIRKFHLQRGPCQPFQHEFE